MWFSIALVANYIVMSLLERLFAWLQNFRRIVVRYEYHVESFLGFVQLGSMLIMLRTYF